MGKSVHQNIFAKDIDWEISPSGLDYKSLMMDPNDPHSMLIVMTRFPPNSTVKPHTHASNYMEYIISGEMNVGKEKFGAGDIRMVRGETGYGPLLTGPNGCVALVVFEDAAGSDVIPLPRVREREALAG